MSAAAKNDDVSDKKTSGAASDHGFPISLQNPQADGIRLAGASRKE